MLCSSRTAAPPSAKLKRNSNDNCGSRGDHRRQPSGQDRTRTCSTREAAALLPGVEPVGIQPAGNGSGIEAPLASRAMSTGETVASAQNVRAGMVRSAAFRSDRQDSRPTQRREAWRTPEGSLARAAASKLELALRSRKTVNIYGGNREESSGWPNGSAATQNRSLGKRPATT